MLHLARRWNDPTRIAAARSCLDAGTGHSCSAGNSGITSCSRLVSGARQKRVNSSNAAQVAAARSYLDAWVGQNNSSESVRIPSCSLLASGTSYMIATVRLERTDTPDSLSQRLKALSPSIEAKWKCPIVLDLRAWSPDGSPHYKPPAPGSLLEIVHALDSHGLAVMGVNGAPKELEEEASVNLGLPSLWATNRPTTLKCGLEDLIQMVVTRRNGKPQIYQETLPCRGSDVEPVFIQDKVESPSPSQADSRESTKLLTEATSDAEILEKNLNISSSATLYKGTVRSGQQISSEKGRALVILGSVSSGGEVLSDGDVIVLGKLRGRALAGLSSDSARIIATQFDPELVSVGGVLSTGDQIIIQGDGAAMVYLDTQRHLTFEEIAMA